jgi:ABC-2 type transport system ATP-binding protein
LSGWGDGSPIRPALDERTGGRKPCRDNHQPFPYNATPILPLARSLMIHIENLCYQYPAAGSMALQNISLHVAKGSLFGLLGPNGAGKTTLISLLTGILTPAPEQISIAGFELPAAISRVKPLMGYVPQDYAFYDDLSALENLQFFAGIQGIKGVKLAERVEYCLDFCQLQGVASQRAAAFSGGLKRRLNIAIGLLTDPDLLVFDEPTVGIDPQSRAFILDQIKALQQQGKTIIYTSHYMEEVEQLCDEIAIIDHGKLLLQDRVAKLQNNQQLLVGIGEPLDAQRMQQLPGQFNPCYSHGQLRFEQVASIQDYQQLLSQLTGMNVNIGSIVYGKANLEQLFLDLTSKQLRD